MLGLSSFRTIQSPSAYHADSSPFFISLALLTPIHAHHDQVNNQTNPNTTQHKQHTKPKIKINKFYLKFNKTDLKSSTIVPERTKSNGNGNIFSRFTEIGSLRGRTRWPSAGVSSRRRWRTLPWPQRRSRRRRPLRLRRTTKHWVHSHWLTHFFNLHWAKWETEGGRRERKSRACHSHCRLKACSSPYNCKSNFLKIC